MPIAGFFDSGVREPPRSSPQNLKRPNGEEASSLGSAFLPYLRSKTMVDPNCCLSRASRSWRCSTASIMPSSLAFSAVCGPLSIQAFTSSGLTLRLAAIRLTWVS